MNLEPTGERMIMEHYRATREDHVIYLMHAATYRFAEPFVAGKRVLDYGCGSGYGAAKVSELAASVVAVDVAPDAIDYARTQFPASNLDFQVIDPAAPLPFADASFDTVLSFQVFEHVADTERYLAEVRRVLVPGGTLILATPDRSTRLLPFQQPWNRWHLHEYSANELQTVLSRHFQDVQILGMGGHPDVIGVEIDRCRKVKWLTLPMTLPFIPHGVRVKLLNLLHRLRGPHARTGEPIACPFSLDHIEISSSINPSVNLIAVAKA